MVELAFSGRKPEVEERKHLSGHTQRARTPSMNLTYSQGRGREPLSAGGQSEDARLPSPKPDTGHSQQHSSPWSSYLRGKLRS